MAKLIWDAIGQRNYESGCDHGVLYAISTQASTLGQYTPGVVWNGLISVAGNDSGAAPTAQYADNIKYFETYSVEEYGGTINAFTYPKEFNINDGRLEVVPGATLNLQKRKPFGLSWRNWLGNDNDGYDKGYQIHMVYNIHAQPSARTDATNTADVVPVNFSWTFTTIPIVVPDYTPTSGTPVTGIKPTSKIVINSLTTDPAKLLTLETILYGDTTTDPRMPLPEEVFTILGA